MFFNENSSFEQRRMRVTRTNPFRYGKKAALVVVLCAVTWWAFGLDVLAGDWDDSGHHLDKRSATNIAVHKSSENGEGDDGFDDEAHDRAYDDEDFRDNEGEEGDNSDYKDFDDDKVEEEELPVEEDADEDEGGGYDDDAEDRGEGDEDKFGDGKEEDHLKEEAKIEQEDAENKEEVKYMPEDHKHIESNATKTRSESADKSVETHHYDKVKEVENLVKDAKDDKHILEEVRVNKDGDVINEGVQFRDDEEDANEDGDVDGNYNGDEDGDMGEGDEDAFGEEHAKNDI